jgi:hypothetical protein
MQTQIDHADGSVTPVWIIYADESQCQEWNTSEGLGHYADDDCYSPGFYWAVCHPGCIPDSDFYGPHKTEELAEKDAEEFLTAHDCY